MGRTVRFLSRLALAASLLGGVAEAQAVSDDFNHCDGLVSPWTYVDPIGDGSYAVTGVGTDDAWLRLSVPAGASHEPYHTSLPPRVEQPFVGVDGQFRVRFQDTPAVAIQEQGLLVFEDDLNWLRFDIYYYKNKLRAYVGSTVGGKTSTERNMVLAAGPGPIELRLTKLGTSWTAEWSNDGVVWNHVDTFSFGITPTRIGIFAGNSGRDNAPAHEAIVDFFEAVTDPLVSEDGYFSGAGPHVLDVFTAGTGAGSVTRDPDQPDYLCTDVVTLTAVPQPGSTFAGWQGDLNGTQNPIQLQMSGPRTVTAVFDGDIDPPVISNLAVTPSSDGALVTWDTDEPATSRVDFGLDGSYGSFEEDLGLSSAHSLVITGLTDATTYHFQVCSADALGNMGCTLDGTFTTSTDSGLVSDDFNNCAGLVGPWTYLDPRGDGGYLVTGVGTDDAHLVLAVPGGSSHDPYDNNLLPGRVAQPVADVDFEFEVKLESSVDLNIQMQGVLIEQDLDDWIRFDVYRRGSRVYAFVGNTISGDTATEANTSLLVSAPVFLRVTRAVDDWTMAWSADGASWTSLVTFTRPMVATQVALYGGNYGGAAAPPHAAVFDWFQDTSKPLLSEDGSFAGSGPFTLSTNAVGSGVVDIAPDQASYMCTDVVTLTAVPDATWEFDHWEGDLSGTQNPAQVSMGGDRTVTAVFVQDNTPPTISNLQVSATTHGAMVTWDTDEPATSLVEYGFDTSYGSFEQDPALVMSHSVALTGLVPDSLYHFEVCSTDSAGLTGCGGDGTFQTEQAWGFQSDDFNQCSGLAANWIFRDPLADTTLDVVGVGSDDAWLRVNVPGGKEHQAYDTIYAPSVVQAVNDSDFEFEVKFESVPSEAYQIEGVLMKETDIDWMRFDFYHDGNQVRLYSGITVLGNTSTLNDVAIGAVNGPLWMRVKRAGDQWTLEYSLDGSNWIATVAGVTHVMALSEAGVYAGNALDANSPPFTMVVDYAFYTAEPIDPEDGAFSGGGPFSLTATSDPVAGGTIVKSPDQVDYYCSDVVQVTAAANPGWRFDHWSGDVSGGANPQTLAMSASRSVTAHFVPDADPPLISGVQVVPSPTQATVLWTTDEPADSLVSYGPDAAYGWTVQDGALVTSHALVLTGLTANTTYHFQVCSADVSGNAACDGDYVFTTPPEGGAVSDDFNHPNVDQTLWSWTDPKGAAFAPRVLTPCSGDALLELRVPAGTEYASWIVNEHLRLTQSVEDEDFELETKLQTDFSSQYQSAGIVVEQDADKWMRFTFEHTGSALRILRASFENGVPSNFETTTIQNGAWIGQPLWMRVTRTGDQWEQSFSLDGTNWTSNNGAFTYLCVPTRAGVMAGNELPELNALDARFDYFFNTSAPISPEDAGCPSDGSAPLLIAGGRPAGETSIRVEWSTDEPATGSIVWGSAPGVYNQGPMNGAALVYDDYLIVPGLLSDSTYHFQITSVDGLGNTTISPDVPLSTGPPGFDGLPLFDIWYGTPNGNGEPVMHYGQVGDAQTWCNIPGRVTDLFGEIVSLTYTLDNGTQVFGPYTLSVEAAGGLDTWRLIEPGDFNAEIDHAVLGNGMNEVLLTAIDDDGNVVDQRVWIDYQAGNAWPLPYSVDWSTVNDVQDVVQVVDGFWRLDSSSGTPRMRNSRDGEAVHGYDRLFAVGDDTWTDYEFFFDFEVHGLNPLGFTPGSHSHAFGVIARWPGHTGGSQQPREGFFPLGGLMLYRWWSQSDEHWNAYSINYKPNIHLDPFFMPVHEGTQYLLRGQVQDQPGGDTRYRVRMWENGAPEPADWFLEMNVPAGGLPSGSLLFVVHDVEASIGNISVTPL